MFSHREHRGLRERNSQRILKEASQIGFPISNFVIPAQAGNQLSKEFWVPACAGMTYSVARTEFGQLFRDRTLRITLWPL
jgi:hypothetical protein